MGAFAIAGLWIVAAMQSSPVTPVKASISDRLVMLGRSPAFHATVDGHDALLELDTGSFELRLSPEFATKNGIDPNSVKLKIADQPELAIKPVVEALEEPDVPTLADRLIPRADGILGLDVLRRYAVGVDLTSRHIQFWPGGKVGADFARKWSSSGSFSADPLFVKLDLTTRNPEDWYRIQAKVNNHPIELIFDTGTAVSSVNPSLVQKLSLRKVADTEVEEIGKNVVLPVVAADSIAFGPLTADFPILNVEDADDPDSDGILGTEALGQGKYIIDMPDLKLYIRRDSKATYGNPFEQRLRLAGLDIFPDSRNRLLALVQPGSQADKAGIRSGDEVVYIGKLGVQDFDPRALDGDPAATARMVRLGLPLLQRNLTITFARPDGAHIVLPLPTLDGNKKTGRAGLER